MGRSRMRHRIHGWPGHIHELRVHIHGHLARVHITDGHGVERITHLGNGCIEHFVLAIQPFGAGADGALQSVRGRFAFASFFAGRQGVLSRGRHGAGGDRGCGVILQQRRQHGTASGLRVASDLRHRGKEGRLVKRRGFGAAMLLVQQLSQHGVPIDAFMLLLLLPVFVGAHKRAAIGQLRQRGSMRAHDADPGWSLERTGGGQHGGRGHR